MTGNRRLNLGKGHELAVAEKLHHHGWTVHPWGQGLFTDDGTGDTIRAALSTHQPVTLWRWIPDLVAVKDKKIYLVDPKTDQTTGTPNFSIEVAAYAAHTAMLCLGLPIVYVWQDFTCNSPSHLRIHTYVSERRGLVAGSGTAFGLVYKAEQYPFERVFGPPLDMAA